MSATNELSITGGNLVIHESFDTMGLSDELLHGIYANGFEKPSRIQKVAILPMKERRDILAQSQSGTGKTGTFVIGALAGLDPKIHAPQVLVISPTRELSQQTEKVARAIGNFMKTSETHEGLKVLCATGGVPVAHDQRALRSGVQFVVGTPGRIFDLIRRGDLKLHQLKNLILDEADQLLDTLFLEQIEHILQAGEFAESTRLALFSATMPESVVELAGKYLSNPVRILLPAEEVRLEGIKQYYVDLPREDWKFDAFMDLYKHMTVNQALIFVNKRAKAEFLTKKMLDEGFTLEYIHGDMEVSERKKRMDDFREGNVRILIATDILARGIDVQTVSVVINYEMPMSRENYFHRIGRSGRFGRKGLSINLISGADEMAMMKDIEKHYSISIPQLPEDLSILNA
jgi:superfamily II DNA/RNA helicase